jgi:mRNA interferase RelE/StbE
VPVYRPVIPPHVANRILHLAPDIRRGVREALRAISLEPGRGEPLRRELQGYMKYRVRRFRIVYRVDRTARIVTVMAVAHRRTVYEDAAAAIRLRSGD